MLASQTGARQMRSEAHRNHKNPHSTVGLQLLRSLLGHFWTKKNYRAVSCFLLHLQYLVLFLVGAISSPLLSLCSSDSSHREQPVLIHNRKTASAVLKTTQGKRSIRGNMTANGFCERFGFAVRFLLQSRVFSCQRCITSRSIFCQSELQEIIIYIQTAYVAALYALISNSMYAALLLPDLSNWNHKV